MNPTHRERGLRCLVLVGLASLAACQGNIGDVPEPLAPPPPDVTPNDVPQSPDLVSSTAYCTTLASGETLASVSPEGHAWVVASSGAASTVRVLDPVGDGSESADEIQIADVSSVRAYTGGDAGLVAQGGLWRLEQMARVELNAPDGFAAPAQICGDPSDRGSLLSNGSLYEHRVDQWFVWTPDVEEALQPTGLLSYEGECIGHDNVTWMTGQDGSLWRVEPSQVTFPIHFADLKSAVATGSIVATINDDLLWIGPASWQSWRFPGEAPKQLSAADGKVWMASGDQLLRFDGETFVEVEHELSGIERVEAHAGGAWVQAGDQLCHQAPGEMIRVRGILPYARVSEDDIAFSVAEIAGAELVAQLDGEAITVSPDADNPGWLEVRGDIAEIGWHTFTLNAGDVTRTVEVKRQPAVVRSWETDIKPIYQNNCTGGTCHGGNADLPALDTYQAWLDEAATIQQRVVDAKNMPPASNRGPNWSDDELAIAQWLEGGMLP